MTEENADRQGVDSAPLGVPSGGFLSRTELRARWDEIIVQRADGERAPAPDDEFWKKNPASIDLTLGAEYYISSDTHPRLLSPSDRYVTIPRGEFALLTTWEKLQVPNDLLGFISMRLRHKMQGLMNVSGFHVDPGFRGHLVYGVYNAGPRDIRLEYKSPVFTIFFGSLVTPAVYDGEYQNQERIPDSFIANLMSGNAPANLPGLDRQVADLKTQVRLIVGLGTAVVAPIAVALLLQLLGGR